MARLLLFAVIGAALWLLYKGILRSFADRDQTHQAGQKNSAGTPEVESMVSCSRCGVNLPKSEARLVNGVYECLASDQCAHRS